MAKRRKVEERQVTRKETVRRRKDAEQNRRVAIGLIAVGALLVILIGAGVIQELVLKPRQPVAVVNNQNISSQDYQKRVLLDWFQAGNNLTDPQGTSLETLDQMIDDKILREQAQQRGITVSPEEIDQAIEKTFGYERTPPTATPTPAVAPTQAPTPTPGGEPTATPQPTPTPVTLEAYQKAYQGYMDRLKQVASVSPADFRSLIESDLLRQKLYEVVAKDVPTTEEQVHARHILVAIRTPEPTPTPVPAGQPTPTPDPSATPVPAPRDEAQALARIIEVQQKLGAGGDFAKLALEYSDDPGSAESGGDLGWFGQGQMVTEFDTAAFALEPGKISDPVKTTYGYHLIQVLEKDPARPSDAYTLAQRKYDSYNTWLSDLRTAAKIERFWTLDKLPPTPGVSQ
ncbi:MAG: peptidylprolyl isomerase [Chloroflexi bacterium]|nr:peptidylprolyl isomerase [Chloroflexota bacterium]